MSFLRSSKQARLKGFFEKVLRYRGSDRHSLNFLNASQFLGVINDNVFKFVMAFLLIDALGANRASEILSATGAIYVIPFLLFSSSAGILADRFSKQKLLVIMKAAEIAIMILAVFAFAFRSVWGCYTLLFLLSSHSAMFGPSKYGIIPELVPKEKVSSANGLITSFTYLAMILGTFLASFLTEITGKRFVLVAGFCLLVALAGFIFSLRIKRTLPQDATKKMNLLFVREIFHTLVSCRKQRYLLPAIFGSAYFLFIGAFTQLNIIPFAIQALHLSEIAGGYLFLSTALGIAFGSFIAGKMSKKRIELGISCTAGVGIALFFLLLSFFPTALILDIFFLLGIGILGGIFIVPFDTFIQLHSENEKRGQTIAAANFLSFAGVLIASIALFLFNQVFDLSSSASFGVIGVLTLCVALILTVRLSELSLSFFSRKILLPFYQFKGLQHGAVEDLKNTILILPNRNWKEALLLMGIVPNLHLVIPVKDKKEVPSSLKLFTNFHWIVSSNCNQLLASCNEQLEENTTPCLFLEEGTPKEFFQKTNPLTRLFKGSLQRIAKVHFEKTPNGLVLQIKDM